MMKAGRIRPYSDVIVARSRRGEAISEFKSAGGKTVRVLDREVYAQATAAAGKKLREITGKRKG
jgi:hypothetical protein